MERIKQMSLKKALFTLTVINLLAAIVLSALAFGVCLEIRSQIAPQGIVIYTGAPSMTTALEPSGQAIFWARALEVMQFALPVLIFICSSFSTAVLFYNLKLKKPVEVLTNGANRIIANDLDFTVETDTSDELGQLCVAFETMRQALVANHKELWRQAEERRRLNAAFSHELRNPVTVLKGAVKLANQSIKSGMASQEQVSENLQRMEGYTQRIEKYVEIMSGVQRLDQIPLGAKTIGWDTLLTELRQTVQLVGLDSGKEIEFETGGSTDELVIDQSVLLQIAENLVSNALRFARQVIHFTCAVSDETLELSVLDDGNGFPPALIQKGIQPFQKGHDGTDHFGMGLYICNLLCQKHGGALKIENTSNGAFVRATIKINKP